MPTRKIVGNRNMMSARAIGSPADILRLFVSQDWIAEALLLLHHVCMRKME